MGLNSKKAMINVEKVAEKAAKEFGNFIEFYIFISPLILFVSIYFVFMLLIPFSYLYGPAFILNQFL